MHRRQHVLRRAGLPGLHPVQAARCSCPRLRVLLPAGRCAFARHATPAGRESQSSLAAQGSGHRDDRRSPCARDSSPGYRHHPAILRSARAAATAPTASHRERPGGQQGPFSSASRRLLAAPLPADAPTVRPADPTRAPAAPPSLQSVVAQPSGCACCPHCLFIRYSPAGSDSRRCSWSGGER